MYCIVTEIRSDYAYVMYEDTGIISEVALALLPPEIEIEDRLIFANYEFSKV